MSNHYNVLFETDPLAFCQKYTVDIKTWFENQMRGNSESHRTNGLLISASGQAGACRMDFEPIGGVLGYGVNTVEARFVAHGGIDAYWVAYKQGVQLPGYADVLRANPPSRFVFTAGMNGCAFVVTDSPKGATYMRVYHHQHPEDGESIWQMIRDQGQKFISYLEFLEYGGDPLPDGVNPVAFNFMYYHDDAWHYIWQPQFFYALSQAAPKRHTVDGTTRPVFG